MALKDMVDEVLVIAEGLATGTIFEQPLVDVKAAVDAGTVNLGSVENFLSDCEGIAAKYWPKGAALVTDFLSLLTLAIKVKGDIETYEAPAATAAPAKTN